MPGAGCGKTEIARRLAKLADAPFIKVEATKYTELGFVGKDVEDIIKDLVEAALTHTKAKLRAQLSQILRQKVEDRIIEALISPDADDKTSDNFRRMYRCAGRGPWCWGVKKYNVWVSGNTAHSCCSDSWFSDNADIATRFVRSERGCCNEIRVQPFRPSSIK